MKKIINGARYSTETAKKMAEWESSRSYSDFGYFSESLYRTKSGKWFLHGSGNAASPYASYDPNGNSSSGEEIIPLSEENAMKWAERKLSGEEYEEIFGEVSEDEAVQATVYVPASLAVKLANRMQETGCSRNEIILAALKEYLKGQTS